MTSFEGLAALSSEKWSDLEKINFTPKPFADHDVDLKIEACGICSSDIHNLKSEWKEKPTYIYPMIVGHEIVGTVVNVGSQVTSLKIGDRVGVGAQSFACLSCHDCHSDNEQYCPKSVGTYNSKYADGSVSYGGYASHARVHEHFVFKIPDSLASSTVAPMLCAGITVYSPLVRNGAGPGKKVGIIGIGGLGHFAIQFAKALGAEVYVFSRTNSKKEDALKLGADHYIATSEPDAFTANARKLNLIIATANSAKGYDFGGYLSTLVVGGQYVAVGLPADGKFEVTTRTFMRNACSMSSSLLGSRKEILEMLQLASEKDIKAWVEEVPINKENAKKALTRAANSDVRYRFTFVDYDKEFGN